MRCRAALGVFLALTLSACTKMPDLVTDLNPFGTADQDQTAGDSDVTTATDEPGDDSTVAADGANVTPNEIDASQPIPIPRPGSTVATLPAPELAGADAPTALRLPTPGGDSTAATQIVPHVYMALQPDQAGPLSIVFAIDATRDNDPGNDTAIRLTPDDGKCNPQRLRRYAFPAEAVASPVFGPKQANEGVTAKDLPRFLAVAVTTEMMRQGMIQQVEDSRPQNVCTRKLWERLIVNESLR